MVEYEYLYLQLECGVISAENDVCIHVYIYISHGEEKVYWTQRCSVMPVILFLHCSVFIKGLLSDLIVLILST